MHLTRNTLVLAVMVVLVIPALVLGASSQAYLWDGTHWQDLSQEAKVAYIKGIGNMADFEAAAGGSGRAFCISQAFVNELKVKSVGEIINEVDQYYQENPDNLNRSVIEVVLRSCTQLCPPEPQGAKK
ncbi:MAG: hypothetical protein ACLFUU_13360 [Desulfobacteraceae bacterium]